MNEQNRRSGRTTRLVDKAIQDLFTTGMARIVDHYPSHLADKQLLYLVMRRLELEHYNAAQHVEISRSNGITLTLDL